MFKKTLIALSAITVMGIAAPGFAEDAHEDNLDKHEENREDHQENREDHREERRDNKATVDQNAKDARQDRQDARQDAKDMRRDDRNTRQTGVSVKLDSQGRNCSYVDEDGETKIRNSCK